MMAMCVCNHVLLHSAFCC